MARVGGTILILMGVERIATIVERLLAAGLDPDTPAAAVTWGTRPQQRSIRCWPRRPPRPAGHGPAVLVIGRAAARPTSWGGSSGLPLGRRIVATCTWHPGVAAVPPAAELGAEPIELRPSPSSRSRCPAPAVADLAAGAYDWVVLTVAQRRRAVPRRRAPTAGPSGPRSPPSGPGTAAALAARRIVADVVPDRFVAEALSRRYAARAPAG